MALNSNLLVSWNFDTVTGSNGSGTFEVLDVSTDHYGKAYGFNINDNNFVLKEDILTGKKQHFETLEGIDTIQLVENDDERTSALNKPSSIKLAIENSMYQIVSDEMMNLFASVNAYAFKFTVPSNKYKPEYNDLIQLRKGFFENVQEKPNLEKYIEFYKWIDSSLGALIDQLKPENSSDTNGLKVTVESHILERNKFEHKLPITVQPNRVYTSGIEVINSNTLNNSRKEAYFEGGVEEVATAENIHNRNYSNNYEVIQGAGKYYNNRGTKENKTIFQTRFSSGDGLSELNRDNSEEYSVYNSLLNRAQNIRNAFNLSEGAARPYTQGQCNPVDFVVSSSTIALLHANTSPTALTDYGMVGLYGGITYYTSTGMTFTSAESKFGGGSISSAGAVGGNIGIQLLLGTATGSLGTPYLQNADGATGDFTYEFWMKPTATTTVGFQGIAQIGKFPSGGYTGLSLYMYLGQLSFGLYGATNATGYYLTAGVWQHIAICRSGGTIRLYVDGSLVYTLPGTPNLGTGANTLILGYTYEMFPSYGSTQGYYDEMRFSDAALYTGSTFQVQTSEYQSYFTPYSSSTSCNEIADNNFIQRNIPYIDENYSLTGSPGYSPIPNAEAEFRQRNNILIDDETKQNVVIEPPVQFNPPSKHIVRMAGAFEDMEIDSPYYNKFSTFSPRTLQLTGNTLYFDRTISTFEDTDTLHRKINNIPSDQITIKRSEIVSNIYPRKDMMGMAEVRTKPNYEENEGSLNTSSMVWTPNSYNNKSTDIRTFWRDSYEDRKKTRGYDYTTGNGSINCLGTTNDSQTSPVIIVNQPNYQIYSSSIYAGQFAELDLKTTIYNNYYDLLHSTEASASVSSDAPFTDNKFYANGFGDISAYSHGEVVKFILGGDYKPRAKPQFIFNNFPGYNADSNSITCADTFIGPLFGISASIGFNLSYQNGLDPAIRPFYDSYENFFENIKSKSHYRSIVPEYAVSNFDKLLSQDFSNPYSGQNYLKILGKESGSTEINNISENLIADLSKFIDKKSNKIKLSFNGIKKLLPYNGFYPQHASMKAVDTFNTSYLENSGLNEKEKQAAIQPFFAPGILFNTIKAGISVDYPVIVKTTAPTVSDIYVLSDPNKTRSADEGLRVIKSGSFTDRLPFESLLAPDTYLFKKQGKYLAYTDPTHYSDIFTKGQSTEVPSLEISKISASLDNVSDIKYKLFINNFLSEIPNFFLKNNSLSYFSSQPESSFKVLTSGTEYSFIIDIKKNENFSMFKRISSTTTPNLTLPTVSIFGPPVAINAAGAAVYEQLSYFPYFPAHLIDGYHIPLTVKFTPYDGTRKYTLEEIFTHITASEVSFTGYYNDQQRMKIQYCLNLKNKVNNKTIVFDTITGLPTDTSNKDDFKWIIQTKFETPLIDYDDTTSISSSNPLSIVGSFYGDPNNYLPPLSPGYPKGYYPLTISGSQITNYLEGIWSSYGTIPKDGQSIQLSISDEGIQNSLLEAVGFKKETKSIGQLATTKDIYEGTVILPYLKSLPISERSNNKFTYNKVEDKYLISIPRQTINNLLKVPNYVAIDSNRNIRMDKIKTILNTNLQLDRSNSIIDLMIKMVNYNIPPHLNWLFDETIEPFAMYIAEFHHTLDKQDLADIWQGNMPQIAQVPEEQIVILEHSLGENQLLNSLDLTKYDIAGKVFKVKYRANGSYSDMLDDIEDNRNYKYVKKDQSIPWYTYNWPYDYFSLVELINVQQGEIFESGSV